MLHLLTALAALGSFALAQKTSPPTPPKGTQLNEIPIIGLGTARLSGFNNITSGNTSEVVAKAIENGYRHIDCAFLYANQKDIGIGIKEGLKRTGLARQDLWITSKLGNNRHGREDFAIKETLEELQLDYLDLFLIHWPLPKGGKFDHVETWKAMEKLVRPVNGTRFIGLSNFALFQVKDIINSSTIKPKFHQFELHPYLQQRDWVAENLKLGITVTGYAPLANTNNIHTLGITDIGGQQAQPLLSHPTITEIAKARSCTPAQVALAWNMKRGVVVIPKASREDHQKENIATLEKCKLTDTDSKQIEEISKTIKLRVYENICTYGPTEGCRPKFLENRYPGS